MKRLILFVCLVSLCSSASASNIYEKYRYQHYGKWYYGYRPYSGKTEYKTEHKAESNNYSRQFHLTYNYNGHDAYKGNTVIGLSSFDPNTYGSRIVNSSAIISEKLIGVVERTASDSSSFDSQAISTQAVVLREAIANDKITRLSQLAEATEVKAAASVVVSSSRAESKSDRPEGQADTLSASEKACATCHNANAADKLGNGNVLPAKFADFSAGQADVALEYITRTDANNCSKKANLSPEAQKELVKLLCKKSNQ